MEELTNIPQFTLHLLGLNLVFNTQTILMTLIVMALLILFGFLATRRIGFIPNPFQVIGELFITVFNDLVRDALDEDLAKKYFPLICSLFMFLLLCNWIGIIPKFAEPTKALKVPLVYLKKYTLECSFGFGLIYNSTPKFTKIDASSSDRVSPSITGGLVTITRRVSCFEST